MRRLLSRTLEALLPPIAGAAVLLWSAASYAGIPALGADCGQSASIVGSDSAGKVTLGAAPSLSCTLTFSVPYPNAPACSATNETNGPRALGATTTPSNAAIVTIYPWVAGDVISYLCVEY